MPVGMELFCATDDEQFEYIKKIIDDCDYYVLILGGRYGSVSEKTGLSYTEMEYRYAVEKDIPVLIFPYQNIQSLPLDKKDKDLKSIEQFRIEASKNRVVKFWVTHSDLTAGVLVALTKQFNENPQQGWQRFEDKTSLLEELNNVRIDNNLLKNKVAKLKEELANDKPDFSDIAKMDEFVKLDYKYYYNNQYKYNEISLTWDEIFSYIGPKLYTPLSYSSFIYLIDATLVNKKLNKCHKSIYVVDDDMQKIKIQLEVQGLLTVFSAKSTKSGVIEFIQLTTKGKDYLKKIKILRTSVTQG